MLWGTFKTMILILCMRIHYLKYIYRVLIGRNIAISTNIYENIEKNHVSFLKVDLYVNDVAAIEKIRLVCMYRYDF